LRDDADAPRIVDDDGSISKQQQREKKEPRGEENVEGSRVVVFGERDKEERKRRGRSSSFGFGTIARDDPLLERGERND